MRIGLFIFVLCPSLLHSQWVQQITPSDVDMLLSVHLVNSNTGIASGWKWYFTGRAIYTTNSGTNWNLAQVPESSRSLVKAQLIDASTGYIAGAYNVPPQNPKIGKTRPILPNLRSSIHQYEELFGMSSGGDYRGLFLKTTDGGRTWSTLNNLPPNAYYLVGMKFLNLNTGYVSVGLDYAANYGGGVLKTTNGGLSWNSLLSLDTVGVYDLFTSDGNLIFVAGYKFYYGNIAKGMIVRSSNGGLSWTTQIFTGPAQFTDIYFTNSSTGFAVGWDTTGHGVIYKSTNAGLNWTRLNIQSIVSFYYGVEFVPGTEKGIAVGLKGDTNYNFESLLISRTTNYGNNWTNYYINDINNLLYSTSIVDQNLWFVCGGASDALIYKTTNGGSIGIVLISNEIPSAFRLYQNYPNPFNPSTVISFQLSVASKVRIIVYDILGREAAALVNEQLKPGTYEVEWDAANYPSGVYYYKLTAADYTETRKMILLK